MINTFCFMLECIKLIMSISFGSKRYVPPLVFTVGLLLCLSVCKGVNKV